MPRPQPHVSHHGHAATQQPDHQLKAERHPRNGRAHQSSDGGPGKRPDSSSAEQRSVLQHGRSTSASDIGPTLTAKSGNLFVLCAHDGDINGREHRGHGLFYHDMCYLDRALLRLCGRQLSVLLGDDQAGDRTVCELTNPNLHLAGDRVFRKETLGLRRERVLSDQMEESLRVHNFNAEPVELTLELEYGASFEDMFVIRGTDPGKRGDLHEPRWQGDTLHFRYDGADSRTRRTALTFDPAPDERGGGRLSYHLKLKPTQTKTITITTRVSDEGQGLEARPHPPAKGSGQFGDVRVETSNPLFDRVLNRAFTDLRMLTTREHGDLYFAAGVPWYVALFGRDSIVTSLQTIAYDYTVAKNTLEVLAKYQGTKHDEYHDEEPGKILHELRVGEMAQLGEVPQHPYYGTVDATPLFIILTAEYVRWSGDLDFWRAIHDNVDRALYWIDRCADHDGDGFVDYVSLSGKGLSNQGWKDSGNSITNRDGSLATPPIALVEVQGYVYRALLDAAWLYERGDGDDGRAALLRQQAETLRARFHDAYWLPDRQFLAVAIEKGGRRAESMASNAGQALWSGIVSRDHAGAVAGNLMSEAMFNGWGVRTLAEGEAAYNPIDYQVGSVWPHDNSLIAAGLRRYGHDAEAERIFTALFDAATRFPHYRLPEVFAGFSRDQYPLPVHYPVACRPQAWAAGALPYLLRTALSLEPDATRHTLTIVRPALPDWIETVTVRGLRVGDASVDLRYRRMEGATLLAVLDKQGEIEIDIRY